jgi:hypothetical protein
MSGPRQSTILRFLSWRAQTRGLDGSDSPVANAANVPIGQDDARETPPDASQCDNRSLSTTYDPLEMKNLGISVRNALLRQSVLKMPPTDKLGGPGIYAIYYVGDFPQYQRIAEDNRDGKFECPIYVGMVMPKESRRAGSFNSESPTEALFRRLRHHSESIEAVGNLRLDDFCFRCLAVDDLWIRLGETHMIDRFQPLWNKVVEGFGIKTPGKRRKDQHTSLWDTIHPGRKFVRRLDMPPNPKRAVDILRDIEAYLAMPPEEKAKVPVKDDGGSGDLS